MAGKVTAPSPQIFTSDPLEQIMAKGVLDPHMSGLAYMFLNAFGDRRQMDQEAYSKGVGESNQQARQIAEMETRQKMQEEFLKSATKLAEMGNLPSSMPILQQVFAGGSTDMDQGGKLYQDVMRSKIAANNRDPNAGGGVQVSVDQGPAGAGFANIKGKGPDAVANVNRAVAEYLRTNQGQQQAPLTEAARMRAQQQYGGRIPE